MHKMIVGAAAGLAAALGLASVGPAEAACAGGAPEAYIGTTTFCGYDAGGGVNAFLGIKYAEVDNVWAEPKTVSYAGAQQQMDATVYPSPCLQTTVYEKHNYIVGALDCLYVNVWAPQDAKLDTPVMVWIHGGAFVFGSSADNSFDASNPTIDGNHISYPSNPSGGGYNGLELAKKGVIVVTLNYRLGVPGFLASTDPKVPVPANLGLRDQLTAMQWVKANIAQFTSQFNQGPQTGPFTLFGESAGAMSVGLHMMGGIADSPATFDKAIMESNPMGYYYKTPDNANLEANLYFQCLLDVIDGNVDPFKRRKDSDSGVDGVEKTCDDTTQEVLTADEVAKISSATVDQVMGAQIAFGLKELEAMFASFLVPAALPWSPVIDGTFVKQQPLGIEGVKLEPGKPYMFGFNNDEGALFAAALQKEIDIFGITVLDRFTYPTLLDKVFGSTTSAEIRNFSLLMDGQEKTYLPYSADTNFNQKTLDDAASAVSAVINDFAFRCGNLYSANNVLANATAPTIYGYHFAPDVAQPYQVMPMDLPACNANSADGFICHTMEIPSVFGTFTATHPDPGPDFLPQSSVTDEMSGLQEQMTTAWTNFAKTSNPTRSQVGGTQMVFPMWTPYSASGGQARQVLTLSSQTSASMENLDGRSNCSAFWNPKVFAVAPVTGNTTRAIER